jgi:hypothetical protein
MQLLRQVKTLYPPPAQTEGVQASTLMVGFAGVERLEQHDDGSVTVVGSRRTYKLWPGNVAWGELLLPSPTPPESVVLCDGVSATSATLSLPEAAASPGDSKSGGDVDVREEEGQGQGLLKPEPFRGSIAEMRDAVNVDDGGSNPSPGAKTWKRRDRK